MSHRIQHSEAVFTIPTQLQTITLPPVYIHKPNKVKKEPQDSSHAVCLFLGASARQLVCPVLQDWDENTLLPCLPHRVSAIQLGARPYSSSNSIRLVWKLLDNWHSLRPTCTARKWDIHSSLYVLMSCAINRSGTLRSSSTLWVKPVLWLKVTSHDLWPMEIGLLQISRRELGWWNDDDDDED